MSTFRLGIGIGPGFQSGWGGPGFGLPGCTIRNNLLRTEAWKDALWAKAATGTGSPPVVEDNFAQAPDSTLTAARILLTLNGGASLSDRSFVQQTMAGLLMGSTYAHSVYLRAATPGDVGKTVLHRGVGQGVYKSTVLTDAWVRIEWSEAAVAGTTAASLIELRGSLASSATSAGVLVWHPQVELGPTATTYQRVNTPTDYSCTI